WCAAMKGHAGWAAQQLAEFLAALTNAEDDHSAIVVALARLTDSFEADGGAFLRHDRVVASRGWAHDRTPERTLAAAAAGPCHALTVPVDLDDGTAVVLARAGELFGAEEVSLLREMARVLALGLRLLGTLAAERRQAEENAHLVASLRERRGLLEKLSRIQ